MIKAKLTGIKLAVFDWSGVISDDRLPVYEANMRLLEKHDKQRMAYDEWLPRTRMTLVEFLEDHGISGDPKTLFKDFRDTYEEVRREGINPVVYEDAQHVLSELSNKGIKSVVVSSHPEDSLRSEAEEYGLYECFEEFHGSIGDKTTGLLHVCRKAGVEVGAAFYAGDTVYDIQAARQAGLRSVIVLTGYHFKERLASEEPDLILENLTALLDVVV